MKSKEALEKIGSTTYYDWSNVPLSEHFKEEFDMIDKSLTELEEIKKCVIIFLSFCSFQIKDGLSEEEQNAILEVYNKLSKVGAKDV